MKLALLISGLEVRVLRGSPLLFSKLASSAFSVVKTVPNFGALPAQNPLSPGLSAARRLAFIREWSVGQQPNSNFQASISCTTDQ
jgi:hypothetical protein